MSTPASNSYRILSDRFYDPATRSHRSGRLDVIQGRFGAFHASDAPSENEIALPLFDLQGQTLLPPLVDAHVHLSLDPWPLNPKARAAPPQQGNEEEFKLAKERLRETFLAGVGLVRDLGDPHGINLSAQQAASQTTQPPLLPRVQTSGPGLHRQGRYGRFIGTAVTDREDLLRHVKRNLATPGVELLKLIATGIINFKKGKVTAAHQFELDELKAAVDLAHSLGKQVAAHASGEEGIRRVVEAGADFVEHAYFISRSTMELLAQKDLVWSPTFIPVHAQWAHAATCGWDAEVTGHLRRILDEHAEMLRFAHSLGVRILPGSDAGGSGVAHGGGLWDELWLMNEAGLRVEDLLEMATLKARKWLRASPQSQAFERGAAADFIALESPIDQALNGLRKIRWVARDGFVEEAKVPRLIGDALAPGYGMLAVMNPEP